MTRESSSERRFGDFRRKALFLTGLALAVLFALSYPTLLILCFAGVLIAAILAGMAGWASARLRIRYGVSLVVILSAAAVVMAMLTAMVGVPFASQVGDLARSVGEAYRALGDRLSQNELLQELADEISSDREWIRRAPGRIFGLFSSLLGALSSLALVLFIALYLAAEPNLYFRGLLALFPIAHRARCGETLRILGTSLRYWMLGRVLSMSVVGLLTGVGLWLIEVPLVLSLAVVAALMAFVPIVGPIVSAVPGILLGLSQSPTKGMLVVLVYTVVQILESYLITPIIDKKVVALPPVLLLASQAVFGAMAGMAGIVFAAPVALVAVILIQRHFVQQEPGNEIETIGRAP